MITTPAIPGLELHLPAQTVITADDGTVDSDSVDANAAADNAAADNDSSAAEADDIADADTGDADIEGRTEGAVGVLGRRPDLG